MSTAPVLLIAAHNQRGYIGRDGELMYRLPYDMKNFRRLTTGCPVIMGRKTWDSMGGKPLPGRFNIVVTRDADFFADHYEGSDCMSAECTVEGAINKANHLISNSENYRNEIWVIGGAEIYRSAMRFCSGAVITLVEDDAEGDVKFPTDHFKMGFAEIEDSIETVRDNGFDIEITRYSREAYSRQAQGLLWNVPAEREQVKTIEREGIVVRLDSIDTFQINEGAPVLSLWAGGQRVGYRFKDRLEAEAALNQLIDLINT